jgi:hypothetical protein
MDPTNQWNLGSTSTEKEVQHDGCQEEGREEARRQEESREEEVRHFSSIVL